MPYSFEEFYNNLPKDTRILGVELTYDAESLKAFHHPRHCVYLLGNDD